MNEVQVLIEMRRELTDEQCSLLSERVVEDLKRVANELLEPMSVLDVATNKNKPRVQLASLLYSMSKTLYDIVRAKEYDGENESV